MDINYFVSRFGDGSKPMAERYGAGRTTPGFVTEGKATAPPPEQATAGPPAGPWGGNEYRNGVPKGDATGPGGDSYLGRASSSTGSSKDSGPL